MLLRARPPKPKFYELWKAATYNDPKTAAVAVVLDVLGLLVVVSVPAVILYRPKNADGKPRRRRKATMAL